MAYEVNFDGIVGPTHNYSGLSFGNVASMKHQNLISNPKEAALQGLTKMRDLMHLGIKQCVLPPHERPHLPTLRTLGYTGSDASILSKVWQYSPGLLAACSSAANMWAANAATICPSADSIDHKVHLTPANLISKFHRSFEAPTTALILKRIFNHPTYFVHHDPLPSHPNFADEGAANHTRLCRTYGEQGVHLFVFGRSVLQPQVAIPKHFPARQTLEASQAIVRLHHIPSNFVLYAQQNPEAIDQGVFHNDVVSVGNQDLFFYHEKAFVYTEQIMAELQQQVQLICHTELKLIQVSENEIPLQEAVKTYLFNSQLVHLKEGTALIAPIECLHSTHVNDYLNHLQSKNLIKQILYQDVRESMQNGGGPACLRLRVVLTQEEWDHLHPDVILTDQLYESLSQWVKKHYRDQLVPSDLADPQLLRESRQALDELTQILQLGPIYSFQS